MNKDTLYAAAMATEVAALCVVTPSMVTAPTVLVLAGYLLWVFITLVGFFLLLKEFMRS